MPRQRVDEAEARAKSAIAVGRRRAASLFGAGSPGYTASSVPRQRPAGKASVEPLARVPTLRRLARS